MASILGNSFVNTTQTALASNVLGILNAMETTPAISISNTALNTSQVASTAQGDHWTPNETTFVTYLYSQLIKPSACTCNKCIGSLCTPAGVFSALDSTLQSIMQKIADWLPANKTTLHLPGQKVGLC